MNDMQKGVTSQTKWAVSSALLCDVVRRCDIIISGWSVPWLWIYL
jgi:hypothetical protein